MFILVKRNTIRSVFLVIAILVALPLGWGKLSGLSNWISPFITLNSVFALKSLVLLNGIGFLVLTVTWFKKRFFCRYLCPVGCVLDWIPKRNRQIKNFRIKKVPAFGKWLTIISLTGALFGSPIFIFLDPMSVFNGFFTSFIQLSWLSFIASVAGFVILLLMQLIWPGLWCKRLCLLGGLQFLVSDLKGLINGTKPAIGKRDMGRRIFIGSAVGAAAAIAIPFMVNGDEDNSIRPPASLEPEDFYALCTRCGSCLKACPTNILKQDTHLGFGLLTPVVIFENAYCLETCNACSVVCPSGAITLFSVNAKAQLIMGKAEVNLTDCLLSLQTECDRCKVVCTYQAISINKKGNETIVLPEVITKKCVGCGACKIVCPKNCISISSVDRSKNQ